MRIAQVSPLYESVPPQAYGGTERVVSFLTEELVRQGHDVTLFASGDSQTKARLVPMAPHALRLGGSEDALAHHVLMADRVARIGRQFDVVHFHIDYVHFPLSRRERYTHATTLHGRLDIPDLQPLYDEFREMPVVSISDAQRAPLPQANWQATVYHGLPVDLFHFEPEPRGYLAFLGRISPEKRVDRAVEIARRTGMTLRVAAKVDDADRRYFETEIAPLFELPFVNYIGEISETEKQEFLGGATALLFPIDWREPFGLVMIEAMACGTPVVALRRGSVPEVVADGITGVVCDSVDQLPAAVHDARHIDPLTCREHVRDVFDVATMALRYEQIYRTSIIGRIAREVTTRQLVPGV